MNKNSDLKPNRKLVLQKSTLRTLDDRGLAEVHGGILTITEATCKDSYCGIRC